MVNVIIVGVLIEKEPQQLIVNLNFVKQILLIKDVRVIIILRSI